MRRMVSGDFFFLLIYFLFSFSFSGSFSFWVTFFLSAFVLSGWYFLPFVARDKRRRQEITRGDHRFSSMCLSFSLSVSYFFCYLSVCFISFCKFLLSLSFFIILLTPSRLSLCLPLIVLSISYFSVYSFYSSLCKFHIFRHKSLIFSFLFVLHIFLSLHLFPVLVCISIFSVFY